MTAVLQVSLYGLMALASVILATAEGDSMPDACTVPLAILALFVTERWKLFCLRIRWANVLGLTAFALGGWEFFRGTTEARLLSLAHVLVYLTWIVLFLEKNTRMYWTMCALAVLHVAVGSVLTTSSVFGLLTILFLVAAIWTLSVFTLHRAQQTFSMSGPQLSVTPAVVALFPWNQPSRADSTVQLDSQQKWISVPFVTCVAVTIGLSGVMGTVFFMFTPRVWIGSISPFTDTPDTALRILQTGFAEEVKLGDIGQILESTHQVFELRLTDEESGQPLPVATYTAQLGMDEPLFRGAVLGEYAHGRWKTGAIGNQNYSIVNVPAVPSSRRVVRQEYRLEPTESETLFAIPPHNACRMESGRGVVRQKSVTKVLLRGEDVSGRDSVRYVAFSEKPRQRVGPLQVRAAGRGMPLQGNAESYVLDYYLRLPSGLDRLYDLSRNVAGTDVGGGNLGDQARRLTDHLRNSGQYKYSLDASVQDSNIDAVEDFLFNRKQGHCEYFASALTLMLRAVGIPARLASGFKGGDTNASTGYFIVQQRHSHVWVEAFLDQQWVILDPTPASRSDSVKSLAPKDNLWTQFQRFFNDLWSHQVVGMSLTEQKSNVYEPMKEMLDTASETMRSGFDELFDLKKPRGRGFGGFLLPAVGLLVIVLLVVVMIFGRRADSETVSSGWLLRFGRTLNGLLNWVLPRETASREGISWRGRLRRRWDAMWLRWRGRSTTTVMRVEFYERYLRMLKSAGCQPQPHQTPREFLEATEPRWCDLLLDRKLADVPARIVAQFYRVRFGQESLTPDESDWLERQLSELERSWSRGNGRADRTSRR